MNLPDEFRKAAQRINDLSESGLDAMSLVAVAEQVAVWLDIAAEKWEQDPLQIDAEECDEIYHPAIALAHILNRSDS